MNNLNKIEENIYQFNRIAGNLNAANKDKLIKQCDLIQEELNETIRALEECDVVETLDGIGDVLVTTLGLVQMYESLNQQTMQGILAITENNLTKFPKTADAATRTVEHYAGMGIDVIIHFDTTDQVFVCRDLNGKVRKPFGYIPVNLKEFV